MVKVYKDLVFTNKDWGGWSSVTVIGDHTLSVQCGEHAYCTPRKNLSSPTEYSTFEIAVWRNDNNVWVTKDFTDIVGDGFKDIAEWVDRENITEVIKKINL